MKMLSKLASLGLVAAIPDIYTGTQGLVESQDGLLSEIEANLLTGEKFFEGDIEEDEVSSANIQRDLTYRWPEGKLYVEVGYEVDPNVVGVLHQAFKELELKTLVRFKMVDHEPDSIRVTTSTGCSSKVGRVGGSQTLKLAPGCARMATIMHEFTHALGVKHTHARPDRDDYVSIMWDNISEGHSHNFDKASDFSYTTMGTKYNYMSVMHYSSHGFSEDGEPTIVTHDPEYQDLIGQRASYTADDIEYINLMYTYNDDEVDLDTCNCNAVSITGLVLQSKRNGVYNLVKDEIVGERYSYKQQGAENYFYYRRSSYKWYIGSENGGSSRGVEAQDVALCPDSIQGTWLEYTGSNWFPTEKVKFECIDAVDFKSDDEYATYIDEEETDSNVYTDVEPGEDEFFWKMENWAETWKQIENGQYVESDVFQTDEGYSFKLQIYPKGVDVNSTEHVSIYTFQVPNEFDDQNVWPLHGKQLTMGIIEQGKSLEDRITMRRSTMTTEEWLNPSSVNATSRGWSKFLTHDLLFYDSSRPNGWDYVYEDSMLFSLRVSEITGVFLRCEPNGRFDGCFFHQPDDDTLNWDQNGELNQRGITRLMSAPMTQWGPRCLLLKFEATTSITVGVSGLILVDEEEKNEFEYPYERSRVYPHADGAEEFVFAVQLGMNSFEQKLQQRIKIEVINHDSGTVRFVSSKQLYGPCDKRTEIIDSF